MRQCVTSGEVAGSIPDGVIDTILPASNRNGYQYYLLGGGGNGAGS